MARVKYYNPGTGKWEYADKAYNVTAPDSGQNPTDKLVLKSPNGTVWNITVSNAGVITATRATEDGGEETVTFTLPVVNLTGDLTGISGDDYVNVICHYLDEANTVEFTDYAEIAWQGSSSMGFTNVEDGVDKAKNYKIKLYTDEARETKSKRVFKDWFATNNYHIKCNFGDCTNFMNNMMMHYLTKSYQYLTPLPRDGARYTVDGFPVLLYINDVFCGIRFWNLKQSDKVYNLNEEVVDESGNVTQEADLCYQIGLNNGSSKGDNSGAFIYGNLNSGSNEGKNFADAHAEIDYYWEDRVWDKTSNHPDVLYNTIQWVSEATDEEFKANLEQYFDKEYLINYFVMMYTCGMGDSICKNFNMLYFPDKGKWYATWWDMDFAFGTSWNLAKTSYDINVLDSYYGASRLFTKLWANFADEIKAKYAELRHTVLTLEEVEDSVNAVWGNVSAEIIAENNTAKYGGSNYGGFDENGASYVVGWAKNRFNYIDGILLETADFSEGYINDSGELAALDRSYVNNNYDAAAGIVTVIFPSVVREVRLAEYDANKVFVKRSYNSNGVFALSADTAYIRVGYTANSLTTLDAMTMFEEYTIVSDTNPGDNAVNLVAESGTLSSTTGVETTDATKIRSDYVQVDSTSLSIANGTAGNVAVRCYDSQKAFIGSPTSAVPAADAKKITLLDGTAYVRFVSAIAEVSGYIIMDGTVYKFVTA